MAKSYRDNHDVNESLVSILLKISSSNKFNLSVPIEKQLTPNDPMTYAKKVYMKVLLWLHPDKLAQDCSVDEHFESTEIFKVLQGAWSEYKEWRKSL